MVNEERLNNAFHIAKEEIMELNNISKEELRAFKKRFDTLWDLLEDEAEEIDEDKE